ncbi:MAG: GIY-YIG nuclease family protein [Planctomycetes bacterium]|nr:GIY-YIG nuclease family protein [Planctomycetota bacterium]
MRVSWLVYVLLSARDGRTYVGVALDVERRLAQHNGALPGGARARPAAAVRGCSARRTGRTPTAAPRSRSSSASSASAAWLAWVGPTSRRPPARGTSPRVARRARSSPPRSNSRALRACAAASKPLCASNSLGVRRNAGPEFAATPGRLPCCTPPPRAPCSALCSASPSCAPPA